MPRDLSRIANRIVTTVTLRSIPLLDRVSSVRNKERVMHKTKQCANEKKKNDLPCQLIRLTQQILIGPIVIASKMYMKCSVVLQQLHCAPSTHTHSTLTSQGRCRCLELRPPTCVHRERSCIRELKTQPHSSQVLVQLATLRASWRGVGRQIRLC